MSDTPQRLNADFRIVWESDWHSGSGEGSAGLDRRVRRRRLVQRDEPVPFLPGSQVKGVLRHQCERLAALFGCDVVGPHQVGSAHPEELVRNFRPLAHSGLLIDRLFGSRFQGECLFVDDAVPEPESTWPSRAHSRTSIDRLSRTARDRALFISEVVAGSAAGEERALRGSLRGRHAAGVLSLYDGGFPLEYALLLAGLLSIDTLGANRSTGLGLCRIEIVKDTMRWNGNVISLETALSSFHEGWEVMLELARGGTG